MAGPGDFTLPVGELDEDWFPNVDVKSFLQERIDAAEGDPDVSALTGQTKARAVQAYVYEKAYRHIYRRKSEDPSSWTSEGEGSVQQSDRQVERWRELADRKQALFETLTESTDQNADDLPPTLTAPSRSGYA